MLGWLEAPLSFIVSMCEVVQTCHYMYGCNLKTTFQIMPVYFLGRGGRYCNGCSVLYIFIVVKVILQLNEIRNGISSTKNVSAVINTSLWSLKSSLGILTVSLATWIGFLLLVFPFKAKVFLPQIACTMSISWTVKGQSMLFGFKIPPEIFN